MNHVLIRNYQYVVGEEVIRTLSFSCFGQVCVLLSSKRLYIFAISYLIEFS